MMRYFRLVLFLLFGVVFQGLSANAEDLTPPQRRAVHAFYPLENVIFLEKPYHPEAHPLSGLHLSHDFRNHSSQLELKYDQQRDRPEYIRESVRIHHSTLPPEPVRCKRNRKRWQKHYPVGDVVACYRFVWQGQPRRRFLEAQVFFPDAQGLSSKYLQYRGHPARNFFTMLKDLKRPSNLGSRSVATPRDIVNSFLPVERVKRITYPHHFKLGRAELDWELGQLKPDVNVHYERSSIRGVNKLSLFFNQKVPDLNRCLGQKIKYTPKSTHSSQYHICLRSHISSGPPANLQQVVNLDAWPAKSNMQNPYHMTLYTPLSEVSSLLDAF